MPNQVKFSTLEDEQLIELIAGNEVLWNVACAEFKNVLKRDRIWNEIGVLMNKTGVQCKNRWRNIKDHYKRQRKTEKNPGTGSAAPVKKRAAYWDRLRFLDNVQDERGTFANTPNSPELNITDQTLPEDNVDDIFFEPEDNGREGSSNDHPETSTPSNKRNASQCQELPVAKNKRYRQDKELANFFKKREEERKKYSDYLEKLTEPDAGDEIEMFFKSVAATVKKFSPALITQTKIEIMQTVCKFELQNLTPANTSTGSRKFITFNYSTSPPSTSNSSVMYDYPFLEENEENL